MTPKRFREIVWKHYEAQGRHALPWRRTKNPYRILVSEIMLQQTQVERVIPYYTEWLKRFPTIRTLSQAPLADVLIAWQGLGYNRRAKALWEAAQTVMREYRGVLPSSPEELQQLPGIGPYTANAVAAFAHNQDVVFVETNIRTAVLYHFFPGEHVVADTQIIDVLRKALPKGKSRLWYSALMDYGSYLKQQGIRLNARTKGYTKQAPFKGSNREARGAVLRALAQAPMPLRHLSFLLGEDRSHQLVSQIDRLVKEGLIRRVRNRYELSRTLPGAD